MREFVALSNFIQNLKGCDFSPCSELSPAPSNLKIMNPSNKELDLKKENLFVNRKLSGWPLI